jgi:PAS domain S-box-containing protein
MENFYQQIAAARQSTAQLNQRTRKSLLQQHELIVEAFEELYNVLDELEIAEEELRQKDEELAAASELGERHHYQNLFELAPDAYLVTNVQGAILEANRAAARLLNVPQEFLVGKPLPIFVPMEERRDFRTELNRLHQQYWASEWFVCLEPRGCEPIDAAVTVAIVQHLQGRAIALGWLVRDITKRKQAESALGLLKSGVQDANNLIVITEEDERGETRA